MNQFNAKDMLEVIAQRDAAEKRACTTAERELIEAALCYEHDLRLTGSAARTRMCIAARKVHRERNAAVAEKWDELMASHAEETARGICCECGVEKAGQGGIHSSWCPKR